MIRAAVATLSFVLAGCGFMQVGERPIPSVPGAVAATAWQSQDPTIPGAADLSGITSPEEYLDALIDSAFGPDPGGAGVLSGILQRDGSQAIGYLQLTGSMVDAPRVAYEAHMTLALGSDGTWALSAVKTREQCAEPLTNGACGDNSGGGAPVPRSSDG